LESAFVAVLHRELWIINPLDIVIFCFIMPLISLSICV
jgi:hypothetical protein